MTPPPCYLPDFLHLAEFSDRPCLLLGYMNLLKEGTIRDVFKLFSKIDSETVILDDNLVFREPLCLAVLDSIHFIFAELDRNSCALIGVDQDLVNVLLKFLSGG